ncbi:MAG TPA: hypothetical protein VFO73_03580 [Candidatus Limnocylindrales bacterium]|nr:hypothetical protein [Candidatus Limnocylindrales bacterium]
MHEPTRGPIEVHVGEWKVVVARERPASLDDDLKYAGLADDFGRGDPEDDGYVFAGVCGPGEDWPSLVVSGTYGPSSGGFEPGILIVPTTEQVFVGAGSRAVSYRREATGWRRAWDIEVDGGFWAWRQHGEIVVMLAELEMAAWSADGTRLWSTFVEPPWSYGVADGIVSLDVMGSVTEFPLLTGPS